MLTKNRIDEFLNRVHPAIWHALCLMVSILLFVLVLLNRSPNFLRPLSMSLRTGFGLVIPATVLIVYLAFRIPGRIGGLAGMAAVMILFAMPLAGLWASGGTQTTVLSGLLPLYDAEYYYTDALRLINGMDFSVFSARRSLFPALLSVLLSLTNFNLMASLAILTAMVGLACYITAREIQRTHGAEISVFVLIVLFLYYRAHSGVSMSENLGVALGTLGFGLLWRGTSSKNLWLLSLGIFVTTVGLNARAGAFFMLPLIVFWLLWFTARDKFTWWKKSLSFSMGAIVLGFILSLGLTRLIAVPAGVPFANFSYTLYGLASGGNSWAYVFEAHPEVLSLQEPEQSKRIYKLAFDLIRENPLQTIEGALFNWKMLFSNTWYSVYSYIGGENSNISMAARWGMYLLALAGIYAWLRERDDPYKSLVMVSVLGVFLSVPLLPPTDAYRMRPYAASIVILGMLPAMGFHSLLTKTGRGFISKPAEGFIPASASSAFSILIIMVTLIGSLGVKFTARPLDLVPVPCESGTDFAIIRFDRGTFINILRQDQAFLDWMPNYHVGLFQRNAHSLGDTHLIAWTGALAPSKTILQAYDYSSNEGILVVAPLNILPEPGTTIQVCGEYDNTPSLSQYAILYVDQVMEILPP